MSVTILTGDAREMLATLPDESVDCCVTSPPYFGLRSYLPDDHADKAKEMGLEQTPDAYVAGMVDVFREVRRVLKPQGTLWLNLGDSYASSTSNNGGYSNKSTLAGFTNPNTKGRKQAEWTAAHKIVHGLKPKDLIGIPWRVAFALQADGWYLRQWVPWVKRNPMPESTRDRPTTACETVFMLTKSERYFFNYEAVRRRMADASLAQYETAYKGQATKDYAGAGAQNASDLKRRMVDKQRGHSRRHAGFNDRWDAMERSEQVGERAFRNSDLFYDSLTAPHGAMFNGEHFIALDMATQPFRDAHYAVMPATLVEPLVIASCPTVGIVLDPFGGAGTTGLVADRLQRDAILIELNPENAAMAKRRIETDAGIMAEVIA